MKIYLYEWKVHGLSQATVLADDYSLTHKSTFTNPELESGGDEMVHRVGNLLQAVITTLMVSG